MLQICPQDLMSVQVESTRPTSADTSFSECKLGGSAGKQEEGTSVGSIAERQGVQWANCSLATYTYATTT